MTKAKDIIKVRCGRFTVRGGLNTKTGEVSMIMCYSSPDKTATIIKIDGLDKIQSLLEVAQEMLYYGRKEKENI